MNGDSIYAETRVRGKEKRLPPDVEMSLFRIAQEALSNVRKHACASRVEVTLEFYRDKVTMSVSDNGSGFEMPTLLNKFSKQHKLGLIGIVERVQMLNGEYNIDTALGKGTNISVKINVHDSSL
jgi:two-component system sensor histidine kinase DegS